MKKFTDRIDKWYDSLSFERLYVYAVLGYIASMALAVGLGIGLSYLFQ